MVIKKNRAGSVTVFIMIFFVTLVSLIFVFIEVSKTAAVKSTAKELGMLWCNSVLAEYDLNLQQRYNIFGFYGIGSDVNRKIDFYANKSYGSKRYVDYQGSQCSLYEYSLANAKVMKKQMIKVGKLAVAGKLLKPKKDITPSESERGGVINNKAVLDALPSRGSKHSITVSGITDTLKSAGSIKGAVKSGTDRYFENQYMFEYLKDAADSHGLGKTFFQNEIEYVVCGKKSDDSNAASIKLKLIGIREAMNLMFILKDSKMNAESLAAAEVITPGPVAIATQKAIQAAWALAESYNDYQLLLNGKKVPAIKDEHTWAVDLESVIGGTPKKDKHPSFKEKVAYIDPGNTHGETYEDYLSLMAYTMDENVKVLRMMDVMQINMKYCYYRDFQLRNYNGGLAVLMNVNGGQYEIKKSY